MHTEQAQREACKRLQAILATEGATPLDPVNLQMSQEMAFYREDGRIAVLAECRAIVLRHPNPMPWFRPFRWLPT